MVDSLYPIQLTRTFWREYFFESRAVRLIRRRPLPHPFGAEFYSVFMTLSKARVVLLAPAPLAPTGPPACAGRDLRRASRRSAFPLPATRRRDAAFLPHREKFLTIPLPRGQCAFVGFGHPANHESPPSSTQARLFRRQGLESLFHGRRQFRDGDPSFLFRSVFPPSRLPLSLTAVNHNNHKNPPRH